MSARAKKPTGKPSSSASQVDTPTEILDPSQPVQRPAHEPPSTPIKAISLKTPGKQRAFADQGTPDLPKVTLRAISEVTPSTYQTPRNLGYLAPPRDPAEVRARRVRDYAVWGCIAVMLACAIALAVWFLARR